MNITWKCVFLLYIFLFVKSGDVESIKNASTESIITKKITVPLFGSFTLHCGIDNAGSYSATNEKVVWILDGDVDLVLSGNQDVLVSGTWKDHYSVDKDCNLHINNFTLDMAGSYSCKLFSKGPAIKYFVGLEDESPKLIVVEEDDNLTLPCHPALNNTKSQGMVLRLQRSTYRNLSISKVIVVSIGKDFEWVTTNDVPVYSNGRLLPYLFLNDINNDSYATDNSSLIIRKIPLSKENITFTCSLLRLYTNYTYILQTEAKKNKRNRFNYFDWFKTPNNGEPVILPCMLDFYRRSATDTNYMWVKQINKLGNPTVEVISLDERILLRNNTEGFRVAKNGSLIISNFTQSHKAEFICYSLSTGVYFNYLNEDFGVHNKQTTTYESVAVEQGNDVSLPCPVETSDFLWVRNDKEILFITASKVKNSKHENLKLAIDKKSLIITNFSSSLSGVYACHSTSGLDFVYNVTEQKSVYRTIIGERKLGKQVVLRCPLSRSEDASHFTWIRNEVEILFINGQAVVGNKDIKLKVDDDDNRSLKITSFSYSLGGVYVCHLSAGISYTYNITVPKTNADQSEIEVKNITEIKTKFGARDIVLHCPLALTNPLEFEWIHKIPASGIPDAEIIPEREWIMRRKLGFGIYPDVLYVNGAKFPPRQSEPDYIDINKNGSLIIRLVRASELGVYTCRSTISDEQYIYDVEVHVDDFNKTISVEQGENVILPCTVMDPRDRELNLVKWKVLLKPNGNENILNSYEFVDGKMISATSQHHSRYHDNIRLADDKQSLIVSKFNADLIGEYSCFLVASSTRYNYFLKEDDC